MFREAVYYVHRQTAADKSGTAGTMVTIKDVAQKAGVPVRMAARALSGTTLGKRRDARERAERIRQAAKELGYCPSEIAVPRPDQDTGAAAAEPDRHVLRGGF